MMTLLLKKPKKKTKSPKTKASPSKSNGKKESENFTSESCDGNENNFEYEDPESSSEEPEKTETEDIHAKRMNELEKYLEAITNWGDLQEEGVVTPYPVEWDSAPNPLRFKAPILHTFDGKDSWNQHIY